MRGQLERVGVCIGVGVSGLHTPVACTCLFRRASPFPAISATSRSASHHGGAATRKPAAPPAPPPCTPPAGPRDGGAAPLKAGVASLFPDDKAGDHHVDVPPSRSPPADDADAAGTPAGPAECSGSAGSAARDAGATARHILASLSGLTVPTGGGHELHVHAPAHAATAARRAPVGLVAQGSCVRLVSDGWRGCVIASTRHFLFRARSAARTWAVCCGLNT